MQTQELELRLQTPPVRPTAEHGTQVVTFVVTLRLGA
jgi:hypothetical protein